MIWYNTNIYVQVYITYIYIHIISIYYITYILYNIHIHYTYVYIYIHMYIYIYTPYANSTCVLDYMHMYTTYIYIYTRICICIYTYSISTYSMMRHQPIGIEKTIYHQCSIFWNGCAMGLCPGLPGYLQSITVFVTLPGSHNVPTATALKYNIGSDYEGSLFVILEVEIQHSNA